jgi:hypothetical protein
MSKYRFSESEQEDLKVAKYNQELSNKLLKESSLLKDRMKNENNSNELFLAAIEKKLGIQPSVNEFIPQTTFHTISAITDWEQLKDEAKNKILYDVDYEDLLTSEEFACAYRHLDEINDQFAKKTGFRKIDWIFLFTAIALQCTRQYVIDPWLKKIRPDASANDEKGRKGNAEPGWYYVETENILINRVPFDAVTYGKADSIQSFLKGGDHRTMTLGHDPLLGWVFGTANILTSTLTRRDLASVHIKYQPGKGNVMHSFADTGKIFNACKERLFDEGWEGKLAVGCGIIREAIHLKSDIGTKRSLPIPVISSVSPEFAKKLAEYGIDTASVSTEIGLSVLINTLISMVHRLFYDESVDDPKLYGVRTRKILLYSNTIASTSNVIATVITKNPKILDVGGLIVTIMRLFSDIRFICKIKQEFIQSALDVHFQGIVDELELMYKSE